MRMQASIEFLLVLSAVAAMGLGAVTLYSQNVFSQSSALAQVANYSQNSSFSYVPPYFLDYAPSQSFSPLNQYSAVISNRSEKLAYNLSSPSYVVNLSEFSHCTYFGWFGHPYPVSGQCFTSNAWDYLADANCATTSAYCIIPKNTTYSVQATLAQRSYLYSFRLSISSPQGTMISEINGSGAFPVLLSNNTVGYASVANVASAEPVQAIQLMNSSGNYANLNQTLYQQYSQLKNYAYAMLRSFNGTGVDQGTQAVIQSSVNSLILASKGLTSAKSSSSSCQVSLGRYACFAAFPFFYVINVSLSSGLGEANQTLYYLGSVVSIRGG